MTVSTPGRLAGHRVLVTGAGSGIGRATVQRLVDDGASVAVLDVRHHLVAEVAEAVRPELVEDAVLFAETVDVADEDAVAEATSAAATALGGLDGVVAAAGIATSGAVHELTLHDWNLVISVNLTGTFLTLKHAIPHLVTAGGGSVVTVGSVASSVIGAGGSAGSYAASKGGVLQLTRSVAVTYASDGIRANCVCPGAIATNIGRHARELASSTTTEVHRGMPDIQIVPPDNRRADPAEVGAVCAFLLSEDASFMTGSSVMVDGGYTAI